MAFGSCLYYSFGLLCCFWSWGWDFGDFGVGDMVLGFVWFWGPRNLFWGGPGDGFGACISPWEPLDLTDWVLLFC